MYIIKVPFFSYPPPPPPKKKKKTHTLSKRYHKLRSRIKGIIPPPSNRMSCLFEIML